MNSAEAYDWIVIGSGFGGSVSALRLAEKGYRVLVIEKELDDPKSAPRANLPEAAELAQRFAEKMGELVSSIFSESLMGTPTTAHILGGACMGHDASEGVIDKDHQVFGYPGLYVMDGSAVSANPGVNPSLTITALAERAMALISIAAHTSQSSHQQSVSASPS